MYNNYRVIFMSEKDKIILELDKIKNSYIKYLKDFVLKDSIIYYKTIMVNAVLQRSLAIIDAYKKIILDNNIMAMNGLIRMQIDNCIYIYGVYILFEDKKDINKIFKDTILNNKQLKDLKVNDKKITDFYIVSKIDEFQKDFKNMYKFYNRFVHFSDSAGLLAMKIKTKNIMEFVLSTDYSRFDEDVIINGKTFIEVSKLILKYIERYWKDIDNGTAINN